MNMCEIVLICFHLRPCLIYASNRFSHSPPKKIKSPYMYPSIQLIYTPYQSTSPSILPSLSILTSSLPLFQSIIYHIPCPPRTLLIILSIFLARTSAMYCICSGLVALKPLPSSRKPKALLMAYPAATMKPAPSRTSRTISEGWRAKPMLSRLVRRWRGGVGAILFG
jgi:hypothetical protein